MDKLKRDHYSRKRGGTSQLYDIACSGCGSLVVIYQKDGVGTLHRLYLDRIIEHSTDVADQALRCHGCATIIGQRFVYEPEKRLAYRLIPGTYTKQKK